VLRVRCELDTLTVPTLSQLLNQELGVGYRALVVDLTDCAFAGSLGLAALVEAHHRATAASQRGAGTRFALAGMPSAVARAAQVSGLAAVPTYPTLSQAVTALMQE
jgi:anti-anti-sigma factor